MIPKSAPSYIDEPGWRRVIDSANDDNPRSRASGQFLFADFAIAYARGRQLFRSDSTTKMAAYSLVKLYNYSSQFESESYLLEYGFISFNRA